ncbi:MAG: response regulator [Alphaproteobacteria bacterium]|nr:response regulator [Alphaproteobacteria bacterium]
MSETHAPPFHILLIEDEPGDADLVRLAIDQGRFICRVDVAENGRVAMAMLRNEGPRKAMPRPDLVLLDLNMPLMNGQEVLREMKADPVLAHIPVVVLTTSEAERDVIASYRLGAAGYISKPLDVQQLFNAIHSLEEYWFAVVRCPKRA